MQGVFAGENFFSLRARGRLLDNIRRLLLRRRRWRRWRLRRLLQLRLLLILERGKFSAEQLDFGYEIFKLLRRGNNFLITFPALALALSVEVLEREVEGQCRHDR